MKILIQNFNIILEQVVCLHLITGSGHRMVYTDSQRVVIGICGPRPLGQTTISGSKIRSWPTVA